MGNFKRGGNGGGFRGGNRGGDRGGRRDFRGGDRGRDRGPVTMHEAVCDSCQKTCEVPFRPTGEKAVFCNDCFGGNRGGDRGDRGGRRDSNVRAPRRDFNDRPSTQNNDELKKKIEELNSKVDRLINLIESKNEVEEVAVEVKKEKVKKPATLKAVVKKALAKRKNN